MCPALRSVLFLEHFLPQLGVVCAEEVSDQGLCQGLQVTAVCLSLEVT